MNSLKRRYSRLWTVSLRGSLFGEQVLTPVLYWAWISWHKMRCLQIHPTSAYNDRDTYIQKSLTSITQIGPCTYVELNAVSVRRWMCSCAEQYTVYKCHYPHVNIQYTTVYNTKQLFADTSTAHKQWQSTCLHKHTSHDTHGSSTQTYMYTHYTSGLACKYIPYVHPWYVSKGRDGCISNNSHHFDLSDVTICHAVN